MRSTYATKPPAELESYFPPPRLSRLALVSFASYDCTAILNVFLAVWFAVSLALAHSFSSAAIQSAKA